MNNITIDTDKVIDALKKNRTEHRKVFEEALEGYRHSVVTTLEEQLERAKKGKKIQSYFQFPQPEDHTKDYDRVIQMLEMGNEVEIELSERDFAQYIQDDWGWQEQFLTANAAYSGIAQMKLEDRMP